jgi:selenocysteine-specific elongation factor
MAALIAETGNTRAMLEKLLDGMLRQGKIERIGDILVHTVAMEDLKLGLISAVEQFHKWNPLVSGISREQLREQRSGPVEIFAAALETLVRNKKIEVAGDLVRLPGHGVVMKDEETESKKRIEEAFATAGLQVPALHDVIAGLKIDKTRAQKLVTLLLRERVLVKISDELVFHGMALQQLRRDLAAYKAKSAKLDVAKFKELTGVSRKYAIPLLEYLDRERVTRRMGDVREIL